MQKYCLMSLQFQVLKLNKQYQKQERLYSFMIKIVTKIKLELLRLLNQSQESLKEAKATTGAIALRIGTNQAIQTGKQITLETNQQVWYLMISFPQITRRAILILKEHYREDITLDDWQLIQDQKLFLNIV
ncbi:unnamed protein product (macronuclear) [Paramecium tetraurelia]|uniref:Uncharacterized protein n=1 Tax=Paramecium tetraurelia TaxID=5888 RepID=A0CSZ0_PARTE|nr:uncharacterized protein GSPATT00010180001 [Paramecium tetraurelia]CAK73907.1 unnamed protein product [Paramecium tetraurelia]|eukprot:XP_001441304.1 hypothetical protein (macronuclear) [Paramecium tetraurelia strain d4-2]